MASHILKGEVKMKDEKINRMIEALDIREEEEEILARERKREEKIRVERYIERANKIYRLCKSGDIKKPMVGVFGKVCPECKKRVARTGKEEECAYMIWYGDEGMGPKMHREVIQYGCTKCDYEWVNKGPLEGE